jgi:hypothetical protein
MSRACARSWRSWCGTTFDRPVVPEVTSMNGQSRSARGRRSSDAVVRQHAKVERSRLGRAIGHERDFRHPEACSGRRDRVRTVGGHQHRLRREALEHLDVDLDAVVAADARERRRRRKDREGGERFEPVGRDVDHDVAARDAQGAQECARRLDALREHRVAHRRATVRLQERRARRARRERQQSFGECVVGRNHAGPV